MKRSHLKTNKKYKVFSKRSGQALVEYILILVVALILILTITSQVFRPMQSFLQDYMGTYVSCLLETGELPKLNSTDTSPGGCQVGAFKGGAPVNGLAGTTGGDGTNDASSNASKNSTQNTSAGQSGGSQGAKSGSSGRSGARSNSRTKLSSGPTATDGAANSEKVTEIPINSDSGGGGGFFKGNRSVSALAQNSGKAIGITGLTEEEKKKLEKKETGATKVIASGEGIAPPPKKVSLKPQERKIAAEKEEQSGFEFGTILRYLFIITIVIILISLIGGQVAQMVKGWEK